MNNEQKRRRIFVRSRPAAKREADLRDLRAENERLREALRPFAREADDWEESTDDDFYPAIGSPGDGAWSTAPATFTVGDLRRARAALNHAAPDES